MRTNARSAARSLALAVLVLGALASSAQAATEAKPFWKVLAISAPTNLPPKQSEVQQLAVEAEGGTFKLERKIGTGAGTPIVGVGALRIEKGNTTATIVGGSFEVGARVIATTGTSIPAETTIVSCAPDCTTANSTVILSNAPIEPETGTAIKAVKIFTKKFSSLSGSFHVGDAISGKGIASGTVVTDVEAETLTASKATTSAYSSGAITLSITELTAPVAFNASAEQLQSAIDAMPALAPGELTVSGGPGGDVAHPFSIAFGGALADQDVEQLGADPGGLVGEGATALISTTVPGGRGTGILAVFPANIGGKASSGAITATVGPLPAGVVTSGAAFGFEWSCPGSAAGQNTVTCVTTRRINALGASPNPLEVPVEVQTGIPFSATTHVELSGGGAAVPATFELPVVVSSQPPPFGLAAIWAGAYEADGSNASQAGGHPFSAASYFFVNTKRAASGRLVPAGDSRDVIVDLQAGFVGNPLATKRCPQSEVFPPELGHSALCNEEMSVGFLAPFVNGLEGGEEGGAGVGGFEEKGIYNDVPPRGYAAAFSTQLVRPLQTVLASVRAEDDYGVRLFAPNNATFAKVYGAFAAFEGVPKNGTGQALITNSTDCAEQARKPPVVRLEADSWQEPGNFAKAPVVTVPAVTNCAALEFKPLDPKTGRGQVAFSFQPSSTLGSSPVGVTAHLHIDQAGLTDANKLGTPHLKRSVIKLPEGLDLNPSQAAGLEACTEAQIGYLGGGFELPNPMRFDEKDPTCPDGSKLGTVSVATPLLESELDGTVYLAKQDENPFHSLLAIYLVVDDAKTGVMLKLPGEVRTDPSTGQITTVFDYGPQLPFEDLTLHFAGGGPRSPFATPEVCGNHGTKGSWTPWSAPESGPPAQTEDSFRVASNCAGSAATRPFSPSFEAGTGNPIAGAYAPLVIKVGRDDGEQELRSLDFSLPPGVSGKLAGIPYCSDAQIADAQRKSGRDELAHPSCPTASELGTVDTASGVGSQPFHVQGHVYLAGPYKGAPVSSVVITPAVAGPFDLGDVVVRAPIYVNPETAELTAKSDPIPTILKGIPLKVRSVVINIDRSQFGINPTNCEVMAATASIGSSDGATARPANRFQVGGCANLRFKPRLRVKLKGGTRRNAKPALTAILRQGPGQAHIRFTSVALPHSEFLEQGHIKTICTRVQFAARQCPKGSIYGRAEAVTPLLDQPLRGPVYLRSSSHRLPDMVVALRGPATQPIEIDLDGRIDSVHGGIRTTFEAVPDAPVSKFVLRMRGGKKSLIVNSTNICRGKHKVTVRTNGQNGRRHNFRTPLKAQCGKKARKHGKRKGHHRKGAAKHKHHARRGKR